MSYKVLVVDDTNFMRKMMADCLKQYGYVVVGEASNGREAVKKYEEFRPDIVMMDLTMPEMNGIDAVKEILKINPDAVVLVCSASNQQDMIFDALDAGAKGYLMKPFNPDHMNEIIRKYAEPLLITVDNSESAETVVAHSADPSDPEQESILIMDPPVAEQLENAVPDEQSSILDTVRVSDPPCEYAAAEFQSVQSDNAETVQHRQDDGMPKDCVSEEEFAQPLEHDGLNEREIALSAKEARTSSEDVKILSLVRRNGTVRNFVTSYMCNWQEEINGETSNFSVICTENENEISVEMTGGSNEKQIIQFTLDGFRQLVNWLEDQLGGRTVNVLKLTNKADQ